MGPQSLIDCTLRVRPHKVKRPLGPGQSLREKEIGTYGPGPTGRFPFPFSFFFMARPRSDS